jgi:betaine-aldehyde dehydrogenase
MVGLGSVVPMVIGDAFVDDCDETLMLVNPATGERTSEVASASARHVELAVEVALKAAQEPSWAGMASHVRARLLNRIADGMESAVARLAHLQMIENGKPARECAAQAHAAVGAFRYYAAVCEAQRSDLVPGRGSYLSLVTHEPYGVVATITPWNSPLTMEAQKIAPALAAGNAVIAKPSEVTPGIALELARIALAAGLPPGLLNVLPGGGPAVGRSLVSHPQVGMVSFTGGTQTGHGIALAAAATFKPVALELGGKSPHIVFDDADLPAAVQAVAQGIFEGSGQSCVAGSRLFVQRSVYAEVVERLVQRTAGIVVDRPDADRVDMGPLATFSHRDRVAGLVRDAAVAGVPALIGGGVPKLGQLKNGAFFEPTILGPVSNTEQICQEEIFGPVLCVIPFDDDHDLIHQANDSAYGLAAGIWTGDFARAWRTARAVQAGTVWINSYKDLSIAVPFGGYKSSGLGREKGIDGMRLYQQTKAIYLGLGVP